MQMDMSVIFFAILLPSPWAILLWNFQATIICQQLGWIKRVKKAILLKGYESFLTVLLNNEDHQQNTKKYKRMHFSIYPPVVGLIGYRILLLPEVVSCSLSRLPENIKKWYTETSL